MAAALLMAMPTALKIVRAQLVHQNTANICVLSVGHAVSYYYVKHAMATIYFVTYSRLHYLPRQFSVVLQSRPIVPSNSGA